MLEMAERAYCAPSVPPEVLGGLASGSPDKCKEGVRGAAEGQ